MHDSIYMKNRQQVNPQTQKANWKLLAAGGGGNQGYLFNQGFHSAMIKMF